jgi:cell wall assembly regulator SMI1
MNIMLGNLSVSQIEKRLGIEFPEETREFMKQTHQSKAANIMKGKWHCFDIPFNLMCGDMETATKIYNSVKERSSECKEALQFFLSGDK